MKDLYIRHKENMKMFRPDRLEDYPIMRQLHKETFGISWPFFTESQYDAILETASKRGYCLAVID